MRKLIVNNLVTLDGYSEGKDRTVDSLFEYFPDAYYGEQPGVTLTLLSTRA
jgi:hypothetical protein